MEVESIFSLISLQHNAECAQLVDTAMYAIHRLEHANPVNVAGTKMWLVRLRVIRAVKVSIRLKPAEAIALHASLGTKQRCQQESSRALALHCVRLAPLVHFRMTPTARLHALPAFPAILRAVQGR